MSAPHLNQEQKEQLLTIARQTLDSHFSSGALPEYDISDAALLQQAGVFVTLWEQNHNLRGCVGRLEVSDPLYKTVQYCTIASATRDLRFAPVSAAEAGRLIIEVSVLSVPEKITRPEQIEIGRHGLLIRREWPDVRVGLLLPQVASKRGWNREQFLKAVCQKAGLPADAWRHADLYTFETEVFEEGEDG
ncbi:MAG: AmmeMemoRadiSam system protein A [Anaerolineae bacterium]